MTSPTPDLLQQLYVKFWFNTSFYPDKDGGYRIDETDFSELATLCEEIEGQIPVDIKASYFVSGEEYNKMHDELLGTVAKGN